MRKIAVDAMGGDNAPGSVVAGTVHAVQAANERFGVTLVGQEDRIREELQRLRAESLPIEVVHAPEVIEMSDPPIDALRHKRASSIVRMAQMHRDGQVDGMLSAGNTGAFTGASILTLGNLPGVLRPTIGVFIPKASGVTLLLDVGANVDCTPQQLVQFGIMGSIFVEVLLDKVNPRVGLLNIGEEASKGNKTTQETFHLFHETDLNFIGNVEGGEILKGATDVIVCDGFVGNVLLKSVEAIISVFPKKFKEYLPHNPLGWLGLGMLLPTLYKLKKTFNYEEYGGVPLLGVNGVAIICHGSSTPKAINRAILEADRIIAQSLNEHIKKKLESVLQKETTSTTYQKA